jgi:hypothetical protein
MDIREMGEINLIRNGRHPLIEEVIMRYTKRILMSIFAIALLLGTAIVTVDAQRATGGRFYRRPIIVRHYYRDPFWFDRWSTWNDPYYYDPYLRAQRERYYKEKDVKDKRKDLAEDREKYESDGYLTPKEQEKLAKAQRKYNEAVEDLDDYNRDD